MLHNNVIFVKEKYEYQIVNTTLNTYMTNIYFILLKIIL